MASRLGFSALTSGLAWWLEVKNLHVSAGDAGSFPGWENPLKEKMANHSLGFLAWEIPCAEELGRLQTPEHDACSHPLGLRFDLWLGSWDSASHAVWSKKKSTITVSWGLEHVLSAMDWVFISLYSILTAVNITLDKL